MRLNTPIVVTHLRHADLFSASSNFARYAYTRSPAIGEMHSSLLPISAPLMSWIT